MKNLEKILESKQLPHFLSEDWIDEAIKKLDRSKMTPEQRMHFEMTLAKQASMIEMFKEEKKRLREEVKAEVKEEVKAEVKEEVKAEGIEEGVRITAQKMKKRGIGFPVISEVTGLSIEEIENL